MKQQTINQNKAIEANRTEARQNNHARVLMRILSWKIKALIVDTPMTELEQAAKTIEDVELFVATNNTEPESDSNSFADTLSAEVANNPTNELSPESQDLDTSSNETSDPYKGCAHPRRVLMQLELTVVRFDDWERELLIAARNLDPADRKIGEFRDLKARKVRKNALDALVLKNETKIFKVSFNSNEFVDFNIDPDILALEITDGVDESLSDPKLISYGEEARYSVGTDSSFVETRATQNPDETSNEGIQSVFDSVKETLNNKKSEAIKKAEQKIKDKHKELKNGDAKVTTKSKKANSKKSTTTPGEEGVAFGNGMHEVKLTKWYENASKKVQYGLSPFAIDYKGWKPNILGKYFASDSTVPVPTWKKNLGIIGAELVKVASAVAALKAFSIAIEETDLKNKLNDAADKLQAQQKVGKSVNDSTTIANQGYNEQNTGSTIQDIAKFARK